MFFWVQAVDYLTVLHPLFFVSDLVSNKSRQRIKKLAVNDERERFDCVSAYCVRVSKVADVVSVG